MHEKLSSNPTVAPDQAKPVIIDQEIASENQKALRLRRQLYDWLLRIATVLMLTACVPEGRCKNICSRDYERDKEPCGLSLSCIGRAQDLYNNCIDGCGGSFIPTPYPRESPIDSDTAILTYPPITPIPTTTPAAAPGRHPWEQGTLPQGAKWCDQEEWNDCPGDLRRKCYVSSGGAKFCLP